MCSSESKTQQIRHNKHAKTSRLVYTDGLVEANTSNSAKLISCSKCLSLQAKTI